MCGIKKIKKQRKKVEIDSYTQRTDCWLPWQGVRIGAREKISDIWYLDLGNAYVNTYHTHVKILPQFKKYFRFKKINSHYYIIHTKWWIYTPQVCKHINLKQPKLREYTTHFSDSSKNLAPQPKREKLTQVKKRWFSFFKGRLKVPLSQQPFQVLRNIILYALHIASKRCIIGKINTRKQKAPRPNSSGQQVCSFHHKNLFMPSDLVILFKKSTLYKLKRISEVCGPKLFFYWIQKFPLSGVWMKRSLPSTTEAENVRYLQAWCPKQKGRVSISWTSLRQHWKWEPNAQTQTQWNGM